MRLSDLEPVSSLPLVEAVTAPIRYRELTPRRPERISLSSAAECLRKEAYAILGYEPTDARFRLAWYLAARVGDALHDEVESALVEGGMGSAIEDNFRVPAYGIGGRMDCILDLDPETAEALQMAAGPAVLDIKSVDDKYLTHKRKYLPDKLHKWHQQIQLYMHFITMTPTYAGRPPVHQAAILVIGRLDNENISVFKARYDAAWCEAEAGRIQDAWTLIQAKRLPAPEPDRGPCTFCDFQSICPAGGKL